LRHDTRCTKHSVHRATRDQTSAHPDRPINFQIQPITAAGSVQRRSNGSQHSSAPVHHVLVYTIAPLRVSLSSLPAIPSLSSDLPFPAVLSFRNTTERFLSSYKAKPRPFSAFLPPHLAVKGPRFSSATVASNRRFSLVSDQRPSIPPPLESSPSYLPESTIFWLEISPENFTAPTVTARGHTRRQWHFHKFRRNSRVFQYFAYKVALR